MDALLLADKGELIYIRSVQTRNLQELLGAMKNKEGWRKRIIEIVFFFVT